MKPLSELTRPNIRDMESRFHEEYGHDKNTARIFLDKNENPYNNPYNRYPDPTQNELKKKIAQIKNVKLEQIFIGNGADEAIDLIYRCFARPGIDNVVAIEPTYAMYNVCANVNDVEYRKVPLDESFQFKAEELLSASDANTKLIWICSPNDPTGNNMPREEILKTLNMFDGLVIVDEAYSDFSQEMSMLTELDLRPNLIVLNTFSKAWAGAAIRFGMAFAGKEIIDTLNKVKHPYSLNSLTQTKALEMLHEPYETDKWVKIILLERSRMIDAFKMLPFCEKVFPSNANFLLVKFKNAQAVYEYLLKRGIVVKNMSKITLCEDCLRITVGSKGDNNELLSALRQY